MRGDVLTRSTGKITFDRLYALGTRNMASSGRLLGLQLPPVPSHLSEFTPAYVRSAHSTGDAAEECLLPDLPRNAAPPAFTPKPGADVKGRTTLEQAQSSESHSGLSSTSPPEEDVISGSENSHGQGRGLRSKLSGMLSLEKRISLVPTHTSQFMSTPFTRRVPKADSKRSAAIQDSLVSDVTGGDAPSWTEEKCNEAWGTEPWHSEQRNILMKTLHMMRCDIESLKMVLRSLDLPAARGGPLDPHLCETQGYMADMHPVVMITRSDSAMLVETEHNAHKPLDDEQTEKRKGDMELAQTGEKDHGPEADKDLCVSELPSCKQEEGSDDAVSTWTHGDSRKRKQWWRELLKALGLTVWVITGAVLVAKVIGVPNLGVGQNVACSGFWGRSEDDKTKGSGQGIPSGVLELTFLNFNETIMKRPTFVMFYAPWCPHCQRLHPVWEQLAGVLNRKGYDVQLAIVDATKHTRLADKYEIVGFPSLIMFKRGHPVGRHRGARDIDTLMSFIDYNK